MARSSLPPNDAAATEGGEEEETSLSKTTSTRRKTTTSSTRRKKTDDASGAAAITKNDLSEVTVKARQKKFSSSGEEEEIFFERSASFNVPGFVGSIVETHSREFRDIESGEMRISVTFSLAGGNNNDDVVLHWATKTSTTEDPNAWVMAPDALKPRDTTEFGDGIASRTPFAEGKLEFTAKKEDVKEVTEICGILTRGEEWLHAEEGDVKALTQDP